ncbi:hypothetical protein [Streptomyces sp. bgisy060]|uniref:hypothetical protein n=1 Tax=Streptomyces sp. bgisy060 TaxID=3413775 RepID=UPI003EBA6764
MTSTAAQLAADARTAHHSYTGFFHRDAAELIDCLDEMYSHTFDHSDSPAWSLTRRELAHAIEDGITASNAPRTSRKALRRIAAASAMVAILAFEHADSVSLPHDEYGRYTPEPGTEYPFSVSDIGRAAVQLLGPDWHAESFPFGVGANVTRKGSAHAFHLGVDDDGDLFLSGKERGSSQSDFPSASSTDGLTALAELVAAKIHELHTNS